MVDGYWKATALLSIKSYEARFPSLPILFRLLLYSVHMLTCFLIQKKNLFPDYMYVGIKFTFRENLAAIISIYSVVMKKAYFVR